MKHHEDDEQAAVFDWAAYNPALKWMHHNANGGKRDVREAVRLRRQGVKPGVWDIFLPKPMGEFHGLYIEMKKQKKHGKASLTKDQRQFQQDMIVQGYKCVVCYGAEEAIEAIKLYCGKHG